MIDFAKITKTLDGLDCRYIHERESNGETIHVFTLFNEAGERFEFYNQQGKRLKWSGSKWEIEQDGKWQIYKPKIVEVTRWFRLEPDNECRDGFYVEVYMDMPGTTPRTQHIEQHTFRFEVPND